MVELALQNCCRCSFSQTDFSCLSPVCQRIILVGRKYVSKNQERFLFRIDCVRKTSFSFLKYIMSWEKRVTKVALRNCCRCSFSSPVWKLFCKDLFWAIGTIFQKTKRGFASELNDSKKPPSVSSNSFWAGRNGWPKLRYKTVVGAVFQKTDFSCLPRVFQGPFLDSWRNVLKNQERFLFWTTWATKTSFSFVKYFSSCPESILEEDV